MGHRLPPQPLTQTPFAELRDLPDRLDLVSTLSEAVKRENLFLSHSSAFLPSTAVSQNVIIACHAPFVTDHLI